LEEATLGVSSECFEKRKEGMCASLRLKNSETKRKRNREAQRRSVGQTAADTINAEQMGTSEDGDRGLGSPKKRHYGHAAHAPSSGLTRTGGKS
jgi:hypothetical protein